MDNFIKPLRISLFNTSMTTEMKKVKLWALKSKVGSKKLPKPSSSKSIE